MDDGWSYVLYDDSLLWHNNALQVVLQALELLDVLSRSKGLKANLIMYNTVLNGCSLAKSKVHADKCSAVMERQGVAKDEMSYVELIKV
jgi:hypothetical protein